MNSKLFGVLAVAVGGLAVSLFRERRCDSAALQPYFNALHNDIKLSNVDENAVLRDKRDLLIRELKTSLPDTLPPWRTFNQGSYAMGTGILPADGDFDIDVGIIFDCTRADIPDPVALKRQICAALAKGNRTVLIRRPCVTVQYLRDGGADYHVDLAIYVQRPESETLDLAFGKLHSAPNHRYWSEQDPLGLINKIRRRFSNADAEQFRRCVRYLKAWRNTQFKNGGAPLSIALTCAAYTWFKPRPIGLFDAEATDADALQYLVGAILGNITERADIRLPVAPNANLLEKLTARQVQTLKEKLLDLESALKAAMALRLNRIEEAVSLLDLQFREPSAIT